MAHDDNTSGLSNRLRVKPLRQGETKIFKLINAGKIDEMTGQPAFYAGFITEGVFNIYDRFEQDEFKRRKIIKNVVGTRQIVHPDGRKETEEIIEPIEFGAKGICVVKDNEPNKLLCLSRANENLSNPFRDKNVVPLWEELRESDSIDKEKLNMATKLEALGLIQTADMNKLLAIVEVLKNAGTFSMIPGTKAEDIRFNLLIHAEKFPSEVIRASNDKDQIRKQDIIDALNKQIIFYNSETRTWEWEWSDSKKDKTIMNVPVDSESISALAEHFKTEEKAYKQMLSYIKELTEVAV